MASGGATEIAEKIAELIQRQSAARGNLAELIDAELAEVLPFLRHKVDCDLKEAGWPFPCTCGLDALRAKWSAGSVK